MGFEIAGCKALVTGANRGIGKVIAEHLLSNGADKVYAAVRKPDSVTAMKETHGDRLVALTCDLTQDESIEKAAQVATDVDLVINNAGVLKTAAPLAEHALDALQFEMNANVFGLLRVARQFAPILKQNGGGALVQLNSVASMKSFPQFSTYCASKAAAYSLTQALREELKEQGTAVLSVHPGPIATDMGDDAGLTEIAEPPELVATAIAEALANGDFHAFPDSMAKQIGTAYKGFAQAVVEAEMMEG